MKLFRVLPLLALVGCSSTPSPGEVDAGGPGPDGATADGPASGGLTLTQCSPDFNGDASPISPSDVRNTGGNNTIQGTVVGTPTRIVIAQMPFVDAVEGQTYPVGGSGAQGAYSENAGGAAGAKSWSARPGAGNVKVRKTNGGKAESLELIDVIVSAPAGSTTSKGSCTLNGVLTVK